MPEPRRDRRQPTWRRSPAFRLARRVTGGALLAAAAVAAVLFVLGSWNPWRLVVLEYRFGNPAVGLLVVPAAVFVGCWLALPVRDETRPRGRIGARVTAGVLAVVGLLVWGVFGDHFARDAEELARSADGERALALVRDRAVSPNQSVKVWTGSGLLTREVGDLGPVCGRVRARFVTRDLVEVDTPYGTWRLALDPDTAVPRQVLGPRCPDGPVPATLGP